MALKYPIYIISLGRFENPKTAKALDSMGVPFNICVEPSEYDEYKRTIKHGNIIRLPEDFSKRGQGGIPVRNWVFEHAIEQGHDKHWILDDNISAFYRVNRNTKYKVESDAAFRVCEDFTGRFRKIALSGMNYMCFIPTRYKRLPFVKNTRVYSCILINHDIPFRWRGRYNEDTDLSLRCLKAGWNTILFNTFQIQKTTMVDKGGNTDTIYNTGDKRREFAESLRRQHPDVTKVVWRYNRWHHQVDYTSFQKRNLQYRDDYKPTENIVNDYGMVLQGSQGEAISYPVIDDYTSERRST